MLNLVEASVFIQKEIPRKREMTKTIYTCHTKHVEAPYEQQYPKYSKK